MTLTASFSGVNKTAVLSVTPTAAVYTLVLSQSSVVGGNPTTATVTLDGNAPTGGALVTLTSSNTAVATVPPNVTVPAGTATATFTVTSLTVSSTSSANITALYGGVSKVATLTVTHTPVLYSLALSPTSVVGGNPSTGTVTLNGNAPTGGAVVTLSSSNTSVATVPASVTVTSGTSSNTFTVTTVAVFASASVTITATYGGAKTAVLTVTPNVAFLRHRDEIFVAQVDSERDDVGIDDKGETAIAEGALSATPSPAVVAAKNKDTVPAFQVASLWALGRSPFEDLFRTRLRLESESGGLSDSGGVSDSLHSSDDFLRGRLFNLGFGSILASSALSARRTPLTTTGSRYFFYTPEMNLMAETELTSNPTPAILYEYIWFNGQPVAQVDSAGTTSWTFTDHIATPLIQTSSVQGITWRAEHEPYGQVFALRTTDQHQPLRLPGQEAEQLNLGPNGATERSYNIFRWYRSGWGRYTQPDPIGNLGDADPVLHSPGLDPEVFSPLYSYTLGNPVNYTDPLGLLTFKGCKPEQEKALTDAFNNACKQIQDPGFAGCVCKSGGGTSIPGGLNRLCQKANRTIRCNSRYCEGKCGWSIPFGWTIRICPGAWEPACGPLGCTLMHEMTHQLGHFSQKWPNKVEECLGCR